jgi:hypothetical protein
MVPSGPLPATGVNHQVANNTTCSNQIFTGTVGRMSAALREPTSICSAIPERLTATSTIFSSDRPAEPEAAIHCMDCLSGTGTCGLAKSTKLYEKYTLGFSADITAAYTPPNRTNAGRWIEMGLRLDF